MAELAKEVTPQRAVVFSLLAGGFSALWCLLDAGRVGAAIVAGVVAVPATIVGLAVAGSDLRRKRARHPVRLSIGLAGVLLAQVLPPLFAGHRFPHNGAANRVFSAPVTTQVAITVACLAGLALAIRIVMAIGGRTARNANEE